MKASQWTLGNGREGPTSRLHFSCILLTEVSANCYTVLLDMIMVSNVSTNTCLEITTIKDKDFTMRNSVFCDLLNQVFPLVYSSTRRMIDSNLLILARLVRGWAQRAARHQSTEGINK